MDSLSAELDKVLCDGDGPLSVDVSVPLMSSGAGGLLPAASGGPPSDNATIVPKHNHGNYTQSLPRLSSRERIQKYTTDRFMSSESRALLRKVRRR